MGHKLVTSLHLEPVARNIPTTLLPPSRVSPGWRSSLLVGSGKALSVGSVEPLCSFWWAPCVDFPCASSVVGPGGRVGARSCPATAWDWMNSVKQSGRNRGTVFHLRVTLLCSSVSLAIQLVVWSYLFLISMFNYFNTWMEKKVINFPPLSLKQVS